MKSIAHLIFPCSFRQLGKRLMWIARCNPDKICPKLDFIARRFYDSCSTGFRWSRGPIEPLWTPCTRTAPQTSRTSRTV